MKNLSNVNNEKDFSSRSLIDSLNVIALKMEELSKQMAYEVQVSKAELKDRLERGLTGDEAIKHYNDWMHDYGLDKLMV